MELNQRVAVVTGGASGLGAATARHLGAAGAQIAIFDRDEANGAALAGELGGAFYAVDVCDEANVAEALAATSDDLGEIRVLVNCAGIVAGAKTTSKGEPHALDVFRKVVDVNLVGTFNCIRLAATRMAALAPIGAERGVIVNTASVAAFDGQMGQAAYAASKAGIAGLTLPVARDLARDGIRVVAIAPGIFATPMMAGLPEEVRTSLAAAVPFPPRLGEPAEFAALVRHACENGYLNGEVIRLDGAIRMQPR